MIYHIRTKLPMFISLLICLVWHSAAIVDAETPIANYTYETIEVQGIDFLEIAASNDFGDYAGNTLSPDGKKEIGFTLIDNVFTTYDYPGSLKTNFYALDNTGKAAGHYKGKDGLYHGVIIEDGEIIQYDFPGAVETFIYGISDETGALSGNIVDETGITRGFSGELIITFPGAVKTYADFVNAAGVIVGSYVDTDGRPHGFIHKPDGTFITIDIPNTPNLRFIFVNAINDVGVIIFRAQAVDDIQRSYILLTSGELKELRFPGSVNTVVRNINQDGSIIGYYDTTDERRLGFVGIPETQPNEEGLENTFSLHLSKGLNMLSLPLAPPKPMNAKSLAEKTGATMVIALDAAYQRFIAWTPIAPNEGFPIEGGQGYIVNVPDQRPITFSGTRWTNLTYTDAAPIATPSTIPHETWAFVVCGKLNGTLNFEGYEIIVRNLRTNTLMTTHVRDNYFAVATADLTFRSVVKVNDTLEISVRDVNGNIVSENFSFVVTPGNLEEALLTVNLDEIGTPRGSLLLQNYPNPFNPETWIPFNISEDTPVSISIYDGTGRVVRKLSLGFLSAGFYHSQEKAAYWNGNDTSGEKVPSGIYFYQLTTKSYDHTRRMIIIK
ncbi:T9SS type A sorting domain-containing protein [Candidatus Poribacteria bacterium]|nr:T9SS type A sorting domain-containing protein [Candidatus Poribacteria bacterium]